MELVNLTRAPGSLVVSEIDDGDRYRMAVATAKVTFRFDAEGPVEIEGDDPVSLFDTDQETDLGLLVRDDILNSSTAFDVIVLGSAHAPAGRPVSQMQVALTVGDQRRELSVFGDRYWVDQQVISAPQPFEQMPLTWGRAFGGTAEVLIDADSPLDVSDPRNPAGRGFDPGPTVAGLAETLRMPPGYPQYDSTRRLPNVENPAALIMRWEDDPDPLCWAPLPMSSALHAQRALRIEGDPNVEGTPAHFSSETFRRAHPSWVIQHPPAGAQVVLEGLTPEQWLSFALPRVRVLGDVAVGDGRSVQELYPQRLVLLPDERRLYLVYQCVFPVPFVQGESRSMRFRLEEGWWSETG